MSGATWTTRAGTEMFVSDMDNGHLRNTIRLLQRFAVREYSADVAMCLRGADNLGGEMAQLAAEGAAADLMDNQSWRVCVPPIYAKMVAEAKRRKMEDYEYAEERLDAAQSRAVLNALCPGAVERAEMAIAKEASGG